MSEISFLESLKTKERFELLGMVMNFDQKEELGSAESMSKEELVSTLVEYKKAVLTFFYLSKNLDDTCTGILDQIVDENESIQSALGVVVDSITRRDMREEFDLEALEKGLVRITEEMALMDIVDKIRSK